jgi:hypothetical protein
MNEAETRAEHIDPALKVAGWRVVEGSRVRRKDEKTSGFTVYLAPGPPVRSSRLLNIEIKNACESP